MNRIVQHITILALLFLFVSCNNQLSDSKESILNDSIESLSNQGNQEIENGDYNKALKSFIECVNLAEQNPTENQAQLLCAYHSLGNIHSFFADHEAGIIAYNKAYGYAKALNDYRRQFALLCNITGAYCSLKNVKEAERYNDLAMKVIGVPQNERACTYALNKGYIELAKGNNNMTRTYLFEAIHLVDKYNLQPTIKAGAYSVISDTYEKENRLDSAIYYSLEYNELGSRLKLTHMIVDSDKILMRLYTKSGERAKALYYQDLYVRTSDSIFNIGEYNRISSQQHIYEANKNQITIDNLSYTITQQKLSLLLAITIIVLVVLFLCITFWQKRKLKNAYLDLFERNKELIQIEDKYRKKISSLENAEKKQTQSDDENSDDEIGKTSKKFSESDTAQDLCDRINKVMENSEEFCNPDFSLAILAKLVDSNTNYVSQVINDMYQKNFRTYVNEYRIKLARIRLMDEDNYSNYSIQGISESVGFKSCTNFIQAFKKFTGVTPSLYQKMAKEQMH